MKRLFIIVSIITTFAFNGTLKADSEAKASWNFLGVEKSLEDCQKKGLAQGYEEVLFTGWVRENYYCCYGTSAFARANTLVALAYQALHVVNTLRSMVDPETEYVRFLLPIKVAAGRAVAIAKIDGPSSLRTIRALKDLYLSLCQADEVIEAMLRREDAASWHAVDLISIREGIENRLH